MLTVRTSWFRLAAMVGSRVTSLLPQQLVQKCVRQMVEVVMGFGMLRVMGMQTQLKLFLLQEAT
jgi:hypothetical protein